MNISGEICKECIALEQKKQAKQVRPIKPTTPLTSASTESLIQEVRNCRNLVKEKEAQLMSIQRKIEKESVSVSPEIQVSHVE
jgi:hypothetical protein